MTKKALLWTLGLALILTLLGTPGLGSASPSDDAAAAPAAPSAKLAPAGAEAAEPDWVLRTPATAPSMRFEHAMAYDSARGVTVLFGGRDGSSYFNDTWEWDGSDWVLRTPATVPPARFEHAMAYDSAREVTVLFAGSNQLNDTWEYPGAERWMVYVPLILRAYPPAVPGKVFVPAGEF
jgi:hypothetical protein